MKLSIIIPVYNVSAYLPKCLDSLLSSASQDFEVILVDDGSKDDSGLICDEYALKDKRVKSFHKPNGGLSDARDFGIEKSDSEYLSFLDSDDYVSAYYVDELLYHLKKEPDLLISDICFFYEDKSKANHLLKGMFDWHMPFNKALMLSPLFAWNKVYKRSLFQDLRYPLNLWDEDTPVTLAYFTRVKTVGYVDSSLIFYRQRTTSIMHSYNDKRIGDIFKIFDLCLTYFKDHNLWESYQAELEYLAIEHFLYFGAFRFLRSDDYRSLLMRSFDYMHKHFPNYLKNPYLKNLSLKNRLFVKTLKPQTLTFWRKVFERRYQL